MDFIYVCYFFVLVCIVLYGLVWYGLVWFGLVLFGLVLFGLVWYGWDLQHIQACPELGPVAVPACYLNLLMQKTCLEVV